MHIMQSARARAARTAPRALRLNPFAATERAQRASPPPREQQLETVSVAHDYNLAVASLPVLDNVTGAVANSTTSSPGATGVFPNGTVQNFVFRQRIQNGTFMTVAAYWGSGGNAKISTPIYIRSDNACVHAIETRAMPMGRPLRLA